MEEKVITREDAIEIASTYNKVAQVNFFMIFLGIPPREALTKAEINIEEYEQYRQRVLSDSRNYGRTKRDSRNLVLKSVARRLLSPSF